MGCSPGRSGALLVGTAGWRRSAQLELLRKGNFLMEVIFNLIEFHFISYFLIEFGFNLIYSYIIFKFNFYFSFLIKLGS